jgi:hypothetical protein
VFGGRKVLIDLQSLLVSLALLGFCTYLTYKASREQEYGKMVRHLLGEGVVGLCMGLVAFRSLLPDFPGLGCVMLASVCIMLAGALWDLVQSLGGKNQKWAGD